MPTYLDCLKLSVSNRKPFLLLVFDVAYVICFQSYDVYQAHIQYNNNRVESWDLVVAVRNWYFFTVICIDVYMKDIQQAIMHCAYCLWISYVTINYVYSDTLT